MKKTRALTQYAVLPCRMNDDGEPEIMLLTSRETGRWVIPKGWPIKGLKPREVAEREAFEESGLVGEILGTGPVGTFLYEKQMRTKRRLCEVRVFLFRSTGSSTTGPKRRSAKPGGSSRRKPLLWWKKTALPD